MKITIPLSVHSGRGLFTVRPLFFATPCVQAAKLERALHKLTRELREKLHFLGKRLRHDELARYLFNPELDARRMEIAVELHRRIAKCRFLFITFEALERRLAFTPSLPELWFEVLRGQDLERRAAEVFSEHFRKREKEDGNDFIPPEKFALEGSAWVHPHEMEIAPAPALPKPDERMLMFLGSKEWVDGEHELFHVGRCLDHLYPDDLDRVLLRDTEVAELARLLHAPDRRPVLLLGPALVGKTALLHEVIYRTVHERKDKHKIQNFTFLLSPQRLISGMSYVGQWENRLLAILKQARKKNHLLYFDDFLGLYHAGVTCQSDLSAAHVLKPYVERRDVRLLAEMTPEMFRVLRERDRGFVDLFHVLPVRESNDAETLRILIAAQRALEGRERCRFAIDILPTVMDLQHRYARGLAFPGKACLFLRRLAVKYRDKDIRRKEVLSEFHLQSGLALSFLDGQARLARQQIVETLAERMIGQQPALDAAADVIAIAKARLNDPERPLGTFLFLGPTGVGKTQCAKAIAAYLFGSAKQLLRFDMNEFVEPGSAARLVGTFYQPEGLLTGPVRQRPFAVVLFDEIEKAHPEVFDLLLQVLGEGRLTDAHGRLADFTNTMIILTSNLGVRDSQSRFGFAADGQIDHTVFVQAAERFFRPEFFNRLDRIVPFGRLSRDDMGRIARGLIQEIFQREGLVRRKCLLHVEPAALERVVDKGFDPKFGARALKRSLERHLIQVVAVRLAEGLPDSFTHISVYPKGSDVAVDVQGLMQVEPNPPGPDWTDEEALIDRLTAFTKRIAGAFAHLRPKGGIVGNTREHHAYFTLQEMVEQLRRQTRALEDAREDERQTARTYAQRPQHVGKIRANKPTRQGPTSTPRLLHEMAAAQDIQLFLKDLEERAGVRTTGTFGDAQRVWFVSELVSYAKLVQTLADSITKRVPEQALVYVRAPNPSDYRWAGTVAATLQGLFNLALSLEFKLLTERTAQSSEICYLLKGLAALPLAQLEQGTHLCFPAHGGLVPIQVVIWPVPADSEPERVLAARREERSDWQRRLEGGAATPAEDPLRLQQVVRIHQENGACVDLRSGKAYRGVSPEWLLAARPLPEELRE